MREKNEKENRNIYAHTAFVIFAFNEKKVMKRREEVERRRREIKSSSRERSE